MLQKFLKRVICILCILSLFVTGLSVSAEETDKYKDGHITIDTVSALNGDSVIIKIAIENNPGIMAMTLSITYDSSALEYERYYWGYLGDYTVVDHPDKNMIRFVNCEIRNHYENRNMISLQFKVKEDADFGFYPIDIEYKAGDFCNWALDKLMPEITPGGIDVAFNGENCSHKKYGDWEIAADPTCTKAGAKQRLCEKCGHVDIAEIPAAGHDFAPEWTIDEQATADSPGKMSRHCTRCDEVTDVLTFTLDQSDKNDIENEAGSIVKPSDITDDLMKEQLPDVFESNGGTSIPKQEETGGTNNGTNTSGSITDKIYETGNGPLNMIMDAAGKIKWLKFAVLPVFIIMAGMIAL